MNIVAVGGSDAGISAALRAGELDATASVKVVVVDAYPTTRSAASPTTSPGTSATHASWPRTAADLEAIGMELRLDTAARRIDPAGHRVVLDGGETLLYDALVVGRGATPVRPPITGLDRLGTQDGVHLLHTMGDTFALMQTLERPRVRRAVIVGAG